MNDDLRSESLRPPLPTQQLNYARPAIPRTPQGLGGWLILPMIGLIINPVRVAIALGQHLHLTQGRGWILLTTPGTANYHPLWKPLIMMETGFNAGFLAWDVLLLVLLFQKRRIFPLLMVLFLSSNLLFLIVDHLLAQQIPYIASHSSSNAAAMILRAVVACAIWVPYFLRSQRVKATFVR